MLKVAAANVDGQKLKIRLIERIENVSFGDWITTMKLQKHSSDSVHQKQRATLHEIEEAIPSYHNDIIVCTGLKQETTNQNNLQLFIFSFRQSALSTNHTRGVISGPSFSKKAQTDRSETVVSVLCARMVIRE